MGCQDAIHVLITRGNGNMPDLHLSEMESKAIVATRRNLYDALVDIGVSSAFESCSTEQIDYLIEAVWHGLRASMQRQSAKGEVPF